jgi:hypothetical protein
MKQLTYALFASLALTAVANAQQVTQRANITGNAADGKCTIEVNIDGAAEVEVQGAVGRMRNLSGQRAVWRRFVCNGLMPTNPYAFRFRGIDGRGRVELLQDPRQTGGRVVFRIEDPQGGREGYTVDLEWRGNNTGQWNMQDNRGWQGPDYNGGAGMPRRDGNSGYYGNNGGNRDRRYYEDNGRWNPQGVQQAVQVCQNAAMGRMRQDGYRNVTFRDVVPDNNPGRNDFVTGWATAQARGRKTIRLQFSCSVDLASGQVRSVDVNRR